MFHSPLNFPPALLEKSQHFLDWLCAWPNQAHAHWTCAQYTTWSTCVALPSKTGHQTHVQNHTTSEFCKVKEKNENSKLGRNPWNTPAIGRTVPEWSNNDPRMIRAWSWVSPAPLQRAYLLHFGWTFCATMATLCAPAISQKHFSSKTSSKNGTRRPLSCETSSKIWKWKSWLIFDLIGFCAGWPISELTDLSTT